MTNEISSTTSRTNFYERGAASPENRRRICLQVLFVFSSDIRGSSAQRLDIRAERAHLLSQWTKISESMKTRPQP